VDGVQVVPEAATVTATATGDVDGLDDAADRLAAVDRSLDDLAAGVARATAVPQAGGDDLPGGHGDDRDQDDRPLHDRDDRYSDDRRHDGDGDGHGGAGRDHGHAALAAAADHIATELRAIEVAVGENGGDDRFGSVGAALALRRERLGVLERALAARGAAGALVPAVPQAHGALAVPGPDRPGPRLAIRPEGARASQAGRIMSVVGLLLVGFFVFQLTGTAVTHERNQRLLLQRFEQVAPLQAFDPAREDPDAGGSGDGILTGAEASGDADTDGGEPEIVPAAEAPARGEPVGILQIPGLGLEEVVVQGTRPAELRSGPGHLRGTPMPGEPGNAAIAGSRLANGAPFHRLDEVEEGDRIDVTTAVGRFRYDVTAVRRVAEGDPDPVRTRGGGSTLTLVTSAPAFLAGDRLVVVAELRTRPVAPRFPPVTPDSTETGFDTAPGGLAPVLGWGALLALTIVAARHLYRRWHRAVAYLLTTPIVVALLVLVFESLAGLLPATF
jgi:LPXTG-site transpeptidase (sortase) family protein